MRKAANTGYLRTGYVSEIKLTKTEVRMRDHKKDLRHGVAVIRWSEGKKQWVLPGRVLTGDVSVAEKVLKNISVILHAKAKVRAAR